MVSSCFRSAIKGLVEKDFVTTHLGIYQVYALFFQMWLLRE